MASSPRTAVVVGASRGIGLALVEKLLARGDRVIATTRAPSPALAATGATVVDDVDLRDDAQVGALAQRLADTTVDDLIVMAGVLQSVSLAGLDLARVREQLEINAIGPLRVVHALLGRLRSGSRVALITSRMGSIGDNTSGGEYGYRMSKAALNMAGKSLAIDLAPRGITVQLLHPGFVKTDMTGGQGQLTAERSAELLVQRIDELAPGKSGRFVHANGEALPW